MEINSKGKSIFRTFRNNLAYSSVSNDIKNTLQRTMAYNGIQGTTLYWVIDFLHGQNQRVAIDGENLWPGRSHIWSPSGDGVGAK